MRILVFGDSIAHGYYDEKGGWVTRLAAQVNLKTLAKLDYDRSVYELGVSGDTTVEVLKRCEREIAARQGEHQVVMIFAIGINDCQVQVDTKKVKTSEEKFTKNIAKLRNKAQNYSQKIFFVGLTPVIEKLVNPMPWHPESSYYNDNIDKYDQLIAKSSLNSGAIFINLLGEFKMRNLEELLADGVHPNTAGHELIFAIVKKELTKKSIL